MRNDGNTHIIASPGLRNPGLRGLGLGLGQVYPGLRNTGEAIMWYLNRCIYIYSMHKKYPYS